MLKFSLLNEFIDRYAHLPQQGTDEWKALRINFIGGSEIASVLKQNKNKSVGKLVLGKLGFDPFRGNVITHWGNVFEELIRLRCESVFSCTIRETGSIPYSEGSLSYSPDGLAVVPTTAITRKFGMLTEGLDKKAPAHLVLFEFKCPHSRVASTEIPDHYWPQINIGMNIIPIMETGIFVQATYRRCGLDQLRYNVDHMGYGHFKRADTSSNPLEYGVIAIYANDLPDYAEQLRECLVESGSAKEIHLNSGYTTIDIGQLTDSDILEEILGNCVNKTFGMEYYREEYSPDVFDRDAGVIGIYDQSIRYRAETFIQRSLGKHDDIVCVMPFKLLNEHVTPVVKDPAYIEATDAHTKATKVLRCINELQEVDTKDEVKKRIRAYKL